MKDFLKLIYHTLDYFPDCEETRGLEKFIKNNGWRRCSEDNLPRHEAPVMFIAERSKRIYLGVFTPQGYFTGFNVPVLKWSNVAWWSYLPDLPPEVLEKFW